MHPVEVSIVIAAYNASETLTDAVADALAQDASLEVIISDDASTDGTLGVARAIADPRVRVLTAAQNAGPGAARNAALEAATGEWVAVLDADDKMVPGRLRRLVDLARQRQADIVLDNVIVERDGESASALFGAHAPPVMDLAGFVDGNHPLTRNQSFGYAKPLLRRAFLAEHALIYDPALRIGEDYMLLADALALGARCVVEPEAGYIYRRSAGSTSARLGLDHIRAMKRADERFLARHSLAPPALKALAGRRAALTRAEAFVASVEHLKARELGAALRLLARKPAAVWHYRYPIAKRMAWLRG